ncbi:acylneuraminate cytidylyltransferase family protein [Roseobacter sp. HKCCD5988]|uniref:acylneuraminate cytidylyltransferase family protein n=1 Tax=Roseobacter sp. HKCCD5988 TaxID=3120338 RepID=UPI0030EBCED8
MINGKRVLAIVPARGGSKGIKNKNLLKINGKSLLEHVATVVGSIDEIDKCIVSTDSHHIVKDAVKHGLSAPFMRPKEISGDFIGDWEVIHHALLEVERIDGVNYDYIVMLQPTSPLRKPHEVREALRLLVDKNYTSVWTLSESDPKYHPLKQMKLDGTDMTHYSPSGKKIVARQQLDKLYHRNGVAYVFTRNCIVQSKNIWGNRPGGLRLVAPHISIDTLGDVRAIEALINGSN